MSSEPIRDPASDHLLTPQNSAFIIIDYQPVQVNSIASMDRQLLVNNIVGTAKAAVAYGLPIVHSTVNVKTGLNKPPIPQLRQVLGDYPTYDRTTINSWEDVQFRRAVEATGSRKLIMTALWTEACLTFPALDALKEGYEVYVVVDAVGGTSLAAHDAALRRMAAKVDAQNAGDPLYQSMSGREEASLAFHAARALVFDGVAQPSGYTEPLLHAFRARKKAEAMEMA